uniref:Uncharacterized protein n=1 Tax=Cacopsylla melanoneura TaxID=428564 RepID=A0A8D9F8Y5_9HEMI
MLSVKTGLSKRTAILFQNPKNNKHFEFRFFFHFTKLTKFFNSFSFAPFERIVIKSTVVCLIFSTPASEILQCSIIPKCRTVLMLTVMVPPVPGVMMRGNCL